MHNLEIIEYFPKGVKPKDIFYKQDNSVNLPLEGPAIVHRIEADGTKKEVLLPFPVTHIEVPESFSTNYLRERQKRALPEFPYPNEAIANLLKFQLGPDNILYWEENLTDFATVSSVLRPGLLADLPDAEQKRILRGLAPTAPGAVVESSDGYIILGVRGSTVHAQGRIMPFPVGHPRYNVHRNPERNSLEDPLQALSRQSVTEMNFPLYSGDMNNVFGGAKDVYVIGAMRGKNRQAGSWNPLVSFLVEAKWDSRQLNEGYQVAVDKYEHERFLTLPIDQREVSKFIKDNYNRLIDHGLGQLLFHGRFRFGDKWYEQLVQELTRDERYQATITEGNPFK